MIGLYDLARAVGLQIDWEDAAGRPERVSDESLMLVLDRLGHAAGSEAEIAHSLQEYRIRQTDVRFLTCDQGQPFVIPAGPTIATTAQLELEDGTVRHLAIQHGDGGLQAAGIETVGYHTLHLGGADIGIAVAPRTCLSPAEASSHRRPWGPAVQVPSLRDDAGGGQGKAFGDFGTLADAARGFADAGADMLAISPTHALFPADPSRYSPYSPSSRLFHNVLYGDPALVGAEGAAGEITELIDWHSAIPARMAALRKAFVQSGQSVRGEIEAFRQREGIELERHAVFDALHTRFFETGARVWQDWPREFHDPAGQAATRFAAQHQEDVDFFVFAQWLAATSLHRAQQAATQGGMAIGLIADLAIGMDGGGSHAWSRPRDLLAGLSVGAPPDLLGPDGQDWGLTTYSPEALRRTGFAPFIATLRAALRHAGGIRIDHILGLNRLWLVPHGASSAQGAYLTYPLTDMLRILAIESRRANAVVIGEDLGTVPKGLRARLAAREVQGMRVMWFEQDSDGHPKAPRDWDQKAAAMTGTHDLPTVAGWWRERDIDWTWQLGRKSSAGSEVHEREARAESRHEFWQAFTRSGVASGEEPEPDDPERAVDAAIAYVASSACGLTLVPMEDIAGLPEQPNLPGTVDVHPNWRRRMPDTTEAMLARPEVRRRMQSLRKERTGEQE